MPDQSLTDRVERLETTVEGLQTLPAEVAALGGRVGTLEVQVSELRTEMRTEFAAVRAEMRTEFAAVRAEMRTEFAAVRAEMRDEFAAVRAEMHEGFAGGRDDMLAGLADMKSELSRQIQESAEEGKRYSRMLFEDALTRVATLIEHRKESPGRKPRAPRRKR